jgi:hypothetical protein
MVFDHLLDPSDAMILAENATQSFFVAGNGPVQITNSPIVPEPSTLLLASIGAAIALGWRYRRVAARSRSAG